MHPFVITDDQIGVSLTAEKTLAWIEEALLSRASGQLQSPPRVPSLLEAT